MIRRQSRISGVKQNRLLRLFAFGSTATVAAKEIKVSRPCANRWFNHFRERIFEYNGVAPRFSGEVEIDVAQFGGMSAKVAKFLRKKIADTYGAPMDKFYWKMKTAKDKTAKEEGRVPAKKRMRRKVIGIMQRGGKIWVLPVPDERADTLLPIIYMVVEQGSTIYTDKWGGFNKLKLDKGYTHKVIDHSKTFSDKHGTHINHVEQFWSSAKRRLTKFNGIHQRQFILHLKESEFRYNLRDDPDGVLKALKKII